MRGWLALLSFATSIGLLLAMPAAATLVAIDYRDQNPANSGFPDAGGPHWTGVVDTAANTLTIYTWTEIPGSVQFWTPLWTPNLSTLPLVWPAVDASGSEYDVPDTFDGTIDSSFAFISTVSARNIQWNEGVFSLPDVADFYPGWGGVRKPLAGTSPPVLVYDMSGDETTMPLLPIHAFGVAASTAATIVASAYAAQVSEVPEASAALALAVAAAIFGGIARTRRLIRQR